MTAELEKQKAARQAKKEDLRKEDADYYKQQTEHLKLLDAKETQKKATMSDKIAAEKRAREA